RALAVEREKIDQQGDNDESREQRPQERTSNGNHGSKTFAKKGNGVGKARFGLASHADDGVDHSAGKTVGPCSVLTTLQERFRPRLLPERGGAIKTMRAAFVNSRKRQRQNSASLEKVPGKIISATSAAG